MPDNYVSMLNNYVNMRHKLYAILTYLSGMLTYISHMLHRRTKYATIDYIYLNILFSIHSIYNQNTVIILINNEYTVTKDSHKSRNTGVNKTHLLKCPKVLA